MELYKHNKTTYNKAVDILNKTGRVAIIQATGTGKSFITMKLFQDYFKGLKKLYIVPKNAVADSIRMYKEWDDTDVVFTTYQTLQNIDEHTLYLYTKAFDVILCDEFHHTGAPVWYKAINVLSNNAKYFIGLSATHIRYLDGNRDMAKELFGSSIVHGPSLREAIEQGILPKFQYISLLYDTQEFIRRAEGSCSPLDIESKTKIEKFRLSEDGSYELGVRLRKYIKEDNRKWIVFCSSIEQMQDIDIDIRNWFNTDSVRIFKLHSKLSRKQVQNTLSDFNQSQGLSALVCVDMLNEGVHVEGVTGLIMLRRTNSPIIFLQQLGRALSASNKDKVPQIIDVVENYANLHSMLNLCSKIQKSTEEKEDKVSLVSGKELFIVDDLLLQAENILESITNFKEEFEWQSWQDELIKEYYPKEGPSMYYLIEGITKQQCSKRARELGVKYVRYWTEDEDFILKRYYSSEGSDVYKRLEGRTASACTARARTLKLRYYGKWTIDNEIILRTYYGIEGEKCFKRLPNFTEEEIRDKVRRLRL